MSANLQVAPPYAAGPPVRRPQRYMLSADQDDNVRWLVAELGRRGLSGYLRRGDSLVVCSRIGEDGYLPARDERDENGPATVRTAIATDVMGTLAMDYRITRLTVTGTERGAIFPAQAAALAVGQLEQATGLRRLRGVTHTPIVRADGSILTAPGYDDASGFLLLPQVDVPAVPSQPSREQLGGAVGLLRWMLADFVWVGPHDEANFLGLLLTPLLRQVCPPPYKLAAIMARQPGSGKSLLAEIPRTLHGGVLRTEMPHDDAELAKSLTSILNLTTAPVVEFDNVSGTLRSSRLAGLLTSDVYTDRVLGSTSNVEMVNDRLWVVTGNNLQMGGDLVRRTTWVTIDPGVPNPELRTGFAIPDLRGWVREHRAELLHALLTMVAAWQVAGRPMPPERSSDSYAAWRAVVAGILTHAGIPGEFDAVESAQQTVGTDDEGWGEFLSAADHVFAGRLFTAKDVVSALTRPDGWGLTAAPLAEALPVELAEKHERGQNIARSLGMWLKHRNGRWSGDLVCEEHGRNADNVTQYRIRRE